MKAYALSILLATAVSGMAIAQNVQSDHLTVYGKVRAFAKADRAHITFQIKGAGKSLGVAFEQAQAQMDTIAERLRRIGLSEDNLSTSFFQSSENFGDKAFLSSKQDYRATMTVTITTDSLDVLEPAVVILSECKVERIVDVSFELTDYQELRKEALKEATLKAREKAKLICQELDIECGDILEVEEQQVSSPEQEVRGVYGHRDYPNPFNAPLFALRQGTENTSTLYAEEVKFDSEVRVVFKIRSSRQPENGE